MIQHLDVDGVAIVGKPASCGVAAENLHGCFFPLAASLVRSGRLIAQRRLVLEILLEAEHAVLAAVAGLLVAAERNAAVPRRAVQIDSTSTNSFSDAAHPFDVLALDISSEAIGRTVCDRDRLVFGIVAHHR